jgi:membrane associated rhomboid family serine protease
MPIDNRRYMQDDQRSFSSGGGSGLTAGLPRPTPVVKALLLANFGLFILQLFLHAGNVRLSDYFGVTVGGFWQLWRYVTFQFLHDPRNIWHISLNMLGVYMLGTPLEQVWGSRRFLRFYLACGAAAGLAYVIIGAIFGLDPHMPIIGASGGVYAIVLACAVLFPHFRIILFIFPVQIRLAAIIIFGGMTLMVLSSISGGNVDGAMSDVAHLGGAVAAAVWIWLIPRLRQAGQETAGRLRHGVWQRRMHRRQAEQEEIDRILQKIHDHGIASLSDRERNILKDTTDHQRDEDRRINRL